MTSNMILLILPKKRLLKKSFTYTCGMRNWRILINILFTDDAFFNRTGLEHVGVVGPEPRLLWTGLKALDHRAGPGLLLGWSDGSVCGSSLQKRTRKKKGRQGLRS